MRLTALQYVLAIAGWSIAASGQVVTLIPNCGKAGDKVCISGSGWAEPLPVCRYTFAFDGASVAPDQEDGLYGPPNTSFTVPAATAGNHNVLVQLLLDSDNTLLQQQTAPFLVVNANAADSATGVPSGNSINLTYTPANPSCPSSCKKIVWIQTVRLFARQTGQTDAQATAVLLTDLPGWPNAAKWVGDQTAANAFVDRIWGRTVPYYGVNNDGTASGNTSFGATGAPPTPATMYDAPNIPGSVFPTMLSGKAVTVDKIIVRFEDSPFCVDGDNAGKFLGQVVTWELHQLKNQAGVVMNAATSSGQPSGTFTAALNQWITGNPPGTGTNRAAFNLPMIKPVPCN